MVYTQIKSGRTKDSYVKLFSIIYNFQDNNKKFGKKVKFSGSVRCSELVNVANIVD